MLYLFKRLLFNLWIVQFFFVKFMFKNFRFADKEKFSVVTLRAFTITRLQNFKDMWCCAENVFKNKNCGLIGLVYTYFGTFIIEFSYKYSTLPCNGKLIEINNLIRLQNRPFGTKLLIISAVEAPTISYANQTSKGIEIDLGWKNEWYGSKKFLYKVFFNCFKSF